MELINLPSTSILVTQRSTGKRNLYTLLRSPLLFKANHPLTLDESMQELEQKFPFTSYEVRQLTIGEEFKISEEIEKENEAYAGRTFDNFDEELDYRLRLKMGYNFARVDEQTYMDWYNNIIQGIETTFL